MLDLHRLCSSGAKGIVSTGVPQVEKDGGKKGLIIQTEWLKLILEACIWKFLCSLQILTAMIAFQKDSSVTSHVVFQHG